MRTYTWKSDRWKETLKAYDPQGYYAYLPAIFIKHDFTITDSTLNFVNKVNNRWVDKHFMGASILWSPFFLAALEYSRLFKSHVDAYSPLFIKAIGIAALFWLFAGLFCLRKILKSFNISEPIISLTLFLIFFGTNLFYYSFEQYMMVHLYSFSLLCVFIYAGMKYSGTGKIGYLILTSAAFALAVLVRPTSICILPFMLPLMCGGLEKMFRIFCNLKSFIIAICVIVPLFSLQCIAWHMESGLWFVRAYSGEGFYFLHPKIRSVLFSFHSGLFIYTPLALVSLLGFINVYRVNKVVFYCCALAIMVWTYLIASWWCWSYQEGFEHRAFIDIYPLIAIGIAHLFPSANSRIYPGISPLRGKIVTGGLLIVSGLCVSLNIVQTCQYYNRILSSTMNWECYKYVFLKTSDKYDNCLGGYRDIPPYSSKPPQLVYSNTLDMMHPPSGWRLIAYEMLNGKPAVHFNGDEFGASLQIPTDSLYNKGEAYFTKVTLTRFEPAGNSSSGALFINDISTANNGHEYYRSFLMNDYPSEKDSNTRVYHYVMATPNIAHKDSRMSFYIWNQKHQNFYLTGLSIEVYRCFP